MFLFKFQSLRPSFILSMRYLSIDVTLHSNVFFLPGSHFFFCKVKRFKYLESYI